jgi:hypothetical protein
MLDRDFELLVGELEYVRGCIADHLKSGDQVLALTGTIGGGIFLVSTNAKSDAPSLLLPLLLAVPLAYIFRLNGLIQHLGGYRKSLEETINKERQLAILNWESEVAPLQKKSVNASVLYVILGALWVALILRGESVAAAGHLNPGQTFALQSGYLGAAVLLSLAWFTGLKIFGRAYARSITKIGRTYP